MQEVGVVFFLYLPDTQGVQTPSSTVDPSKVIEFFAEALRNPTPIGQVELDMLWHSASEVSPVWLEYFPAEQGLHSASEVSPVWLEYLPAEQGLHSASEVTPVWSEYLPAVQILVRLILVQLVSSFSTADSYPVGQLEQESPIENGLTFGEDMYEPEGQQPYRAMVLLSTNAPVLPVKDNHAPPHNVRWKPLSLKTTSIKEK